VLRGFPIRWAPQNVQFGPGSGGWRDCACDFVMPVGRAVSKIGGGLAEFHRAAMSFVNISREAIKSQKKYGTTEDA
jgi:hypothetical protein